MKVLRSILIALSLSAISSTAFSGSVGGAKVTSIRVDANGFGIITFSTSLTSPAACMNPYYANALAINANTSGGKALLAAALFARGKNTTVYAWGTGACNLYAATLEDLNTFQELN